jgi:DNA-binding NarL/FixJ family response regulator
VADARVQRAERTPRPQSVHVVEWLHHTVSDDRSATVYLVESGVTPPASQLARGSTAWLPLEADAEDVYVAACAILRGLSVVAPAVLPTARPRRAREPVRTDDGENAPHLTDRELEVLRALAEGLGNKQIAARLGISASTVKYHLQAIFGKLGVSTRSEAVSYGLRRGVVPL